MLIAVRAYGDMHRIQGISVRSYKTHLTLLIPNMFYFTLFNKDCQNEILLNCNSFLLPFPSISLDLASSVRLQEDSILAIFIVRSKHVSLRSNGTPMDPVHMKRMVFFVCFILFFHFFFICFVFHGN